MFAVEFALTLLLSFGMELVYVGYTLFVARGRTLPAVLSSGIISVLGTSLTLSYTRHEGVLVAVVIGEMLGTLTVMSLSKSRIFIKPSSPSEET